MKQIPPTSMLVSILALLLTQNCYAMLLGQVAASDRSTMFRVLTLDSPGKVAQPSATTQGATTHGATRQGATTSVAPGLLNRIISLSVQAQPLVVAAGRPSPQIKLVGIDARMPAHNHGMNVTPSLQQVASNEWKVEGFKLHMRGKWVVSLTTQIDGKNEVVTFELNI